MIIQIFNAATGVSSFVLGVCLAIFLSYSQKSRLMVASFTPSRQRSALLSVFAALWGVPVLMILGSFKLFSYALTPYESLPSAILTGVTWAVSTMVSIVAVVNLVKLMRDGK